MRLEAALAFLREKRGVVQPNDSFMAQLQVKVGLYKMHAREGRSVVCVRTHKYSCACPQQRRQTYDARLEAQRTEARAKHERMFGPTTTSTAAAAPKAAARVAIGPALPPHLQKQVQQQEEAAGDGGGKGTDGGVAIGPALPPHSQQEDNIKKAEEAAATPALRAIGPALPPHVQQPSPSPSARKPIGPSLPPPPQAAPCGGGEGGGGGQKRPALGPSMPPGKRAKE